MHYIISSACDIYTFKCEIGIVFFFHLYVFSQSRVKQGVNLSVDEIVQGTLGWPVTYN